MSSARSDLLIIIGVALATTMGLFVLHTWYGTFLDVQYHARLRENGPSEALLSAREEEQKALQAGKVPLSQAMDAVARAGRPASISPAPSEDLSAVSGWIYRRGFKPATAHPVRVPAAPKPAAQPAAEPPAAADAAPAAPPAKPLKVRTAVVKPSAAQ
jgi:hypothetical protein